LYLLVIENKIAKDNFEKNHKKTKQKNYAEKQYSNPQCFKEKKLQN
jgi:hypothetical protein